MKLKKKKVDFRLLLGISTIVVAVDWFLQASYRDLGFGVANSGISFGFASESGWLWKVVLPLTILIWAAYEYSKKFKFDVFLACLLIGGVGNLVPRLIYGNVWDYIYFQPLQLWINMSDILIFGSVLSYILIADEST